MFWYTYSEALCSKSLILNDFLTLAEWTGLEPATPGVTGRYSNQLNYHSMQIRFVESGVPYEIRTRVIAVKGRCPRPLDEGD